MNFGIYTVRDEASTLFMGIQTSENNDVAIRNFDYALSNNQLMHFRPQDYSLWYVGDFDNVTGVISSKDPICLKRGTKNGKKS